MDKPEKELQYVDIDGSYLEGGGQALRNALSLSCILRRPVHVFNIRANRPKPGLSHQHLHGINMLRDITGALVTGNFLESTSVKFAPSSINADAYTVNTRTAASITLIYQMALPVLLFGGKSSRLEVLGGTHVSFAPQMDFMQEILQPNLQRFGIEFELKLLHYGFYPRGNGRCVLNVTPITGLRAMTAVEFGRIQTIKGWAFCAGRLPKSIAMDMQQTAQREIHRLWPHSICNIQSYKVTADKGSDNGAGITLAAITTTDCVVGSGALGEKHIDGHALGSVAACSLVGYCKNEICIDPHVQDQIIIYMALAEGCSRFRTGVLTNHTLTAIHVCEQMTGVKFDTMKESSGNMQISCDGLGLRNALLH